MDFRKRLTEISSAAWVIIVAALLKFMIHLYMAPEYGYFMDEFYTVALSKHLAWGYVDLPPLAPALLALSRALMGDSLLAIHVVPALAGAGTLVFTCLIVRAFGGKTFAVLLAALAFFFTPLWLGLDSIFCYDSIDQFILNGFLYTLVRFLRNGDKRLWIVLGLLAGVACMTKVTILFWGPGFLVAILLSKYRKDLLTPWPWLGAALCVLIVSPYLLWQQANGWQTLEYWRAYGTGRVYQASLLQYLININIQMNPYFVPLWIAGLARLFHRMDGVSYVFLGVLFLVTFGVEFLLHASVRMLAALFIPLIASGALFFEEILPPVRWGRFARGAAAAYLLLTGLYLLPASLPVLPPEQISHYSDSVREGYQSLREFNGMTSVYPIMLAYRLGWDELVQTVAGVYHDLPEEERAVAGIYADWYSEAGAVDLLGPKYGLPHAVSGALTYYLWGPGYSWDVMVLVTGRTNPLGVFFGQCERKASVKKAYDPYNSYVIYVCRKPKQSADVIWSSLKLYR